MTLEKFLEALGSGIETGSIFLPLSFLNTVQVHTGFHQVWYQGIVKATVSYRTLSKEVCNGGVACSLAADKPRPLLQNSLIVTLLWLFVKF